MLKLYKRTSEAFRYHEAWCHKGVITEHWGVVGETGETREHKVKRGKDEDEAIGEVLRPASDDGFRPFEDLAVLLIEYAVDGFGTKRDLEKRHALEERMDETLGWTGLGNCDGGSIGSNTMEVCCYVVDFEIAKRVIEADLQGTEFSNFTRIYLED
jgi:hypothetical protein